MTVSGRVMVTPSVSVYLPQQYGETSAFHLERDVVFRQMGNLFWLDSTADSIKGFMEYARWRAEYIAEHAKEETR